MESKILAKLNELEKKIDYLTQKIKESTDLYRQIQIFDEEQLRSFYDELNKLKQPPQ
jgi:hypothetical protein